MKYSLQKSRANNRSVDSEFERSSRVFVVIPCYKVKDAILKVLSEIGPEVIQIIVVDDYCPQDTGTYVLENCPDPRVKVIRNSKNLGVGGATIAGYREALKNQAEIVVKIDGDGQMSPNLLPSLVRPLQLGTADYVKGNRFFELESLENMPLIRLVGNGIFSFVNKVACGYWNLMDPTNGFTAIHYSALSLLALDKIDPGYFFESDMLFRLNTIRAVVVEMPMKAKYGEEKSNLTVAEVFLDFPLKYSIRLFKRLFYNYALRDFNLCSLQILAGVALASFGILFGATTWYQNTKLHLVTPTGTVMLAVLPIIISVQLLLEALAYDVQNIPKIPLQNYFAWTGDALD